MKETLLKLTRDRIALSEFLKNVKKLQKMSGKSRLSQQVRSLNAGEIRKLEKQGNDAEEWKKIKVHQKFVPDFISNSRFLGSCVLGRFSGKPMHIESGMAHPSGIYNSLLSNTEADDCLVLDCRLVHNIIIKSGAVLFDMGSVAASGSCAFGNGVNIAIGPEVGGREILTYAEITLPVAELMVLHPNDRDLRDAYRKFNLKYCDSATLPYGVVEGNSVLLHSVKVENSYIGSHVRIDSAQTIRNATLLGAEDEMTEVCDSAVVENSCLQWGCRVTEMALVDRSVMMENSVAERHGKVTQSIIGSGTLIGGGEVTSSLVGPFVGFHHQSLLIGALWPEGKGNVGYGANIGSNHTSKLPDQEIWCGEGTFFGLGVNIKFPSHFSESPYSIFATGIDTLPQKITFPFSLINKPGLNIPSLSPAYNEILPGWVLTNNTYMLFRAERKFLARNRSKRSFLNCQVFKPSVVALMLKARDALNSVEPVLEIYTDREISGLGKNFMTEKSRQEGLSAYSLFIEYCVLKTYIRRIEELLETGKTTAVSPVFERKSRNEAYEQARNVMMNEGWHERSMRENFLRFLHIQETIASDTQASKHKDDIRVLKMMGSSWPEKLLSGHDETVIALWQETETWKNHLDRLMERIEKTDEGKL